MDGRARDSVSLRSAFPFYFATGGFYAYDTLVLCAFEKRRVERSLKWKRA